MDLKDELEGLRVQIAIDEDGTSSPPNLPLGTIIRSVTGSDGEQYHLVRLDHPVRCIRATTGEEWTLLDLAIVPYFRGVSLEGLTNERKGNFMANVRLVNLMGPLALDDPLIDMSKAEYFALGRVRRA